MTIFVQMTASRPALDVSLDPPDSLVLDCHLKPTRHPDGPDVPWTGTWPIRFRHTGGSGFDSLRADFVDGACRVRYEAQEEMPLGDWVLDEMNVDPIILDGEVCEVRAAPAVCITFTGRRSDADD